MTLRDKLQALTAPCREVDAEIAVMFGWKQETRHDQWCDPYAVWIRDGYDVDLPKFTASLDAAVELVEREMPGNWDVIRLHPYGTYSGAIQGRHHSEHPIPAVALLLALLDAKEKER